MLSRLLDRPDGQVAVAVAIGLALGLAAVIASPFLVLGGLLAVAVLPWLSRDIVPATVCLLVFYSTIFEIDVLPVVPVGVGSLNPMDLVLVLYLGLLVLRRLFEPGFRLVLGLPELAVVLFVLALMLSTIVGLSEGATDLDDATNAIRYAGYYLVLVMVGALLRDRSDIDRLVNAFLGLAVIVSLLMIVQAIVGDSVQIVNGRVEPFGGESGEPGTVARVIPSGRYLVLISFWSFSTLLAMVRVRTWPYLLGWVATGIAVLLTFNRNFWISTVLILGLIFLLAGVEDRRRVTKQLGILAAGVCCAFGLVLVGPDTEAKAAVSAFGDRTLSIFDSGTYNETVSTDRNVSSLEFRRIENEYAFEHLSPPSPLGLGAGAPYRPEDRRIDSEEFINGPAYIHNAHLWVLLTSGFLGYGALLVAYGSSISRGLRTWRRLPTAKERAISLTFGACLIGILLQSIVDPVLTDITWAPVFGVVTGITAAYRRHTIEPDRTTTQDREMSTP